jgi:CHAT domain-containing protein
MPRQNSLLLSFFLVLCTATAVHASVRNELEAQTRELFGRYADGDLARFNELWKAAAVPDPTIVADTMRTQCITVLRLDVDAIDAREADADVAATVTIEKRNRATGTTRIEHRHPRLHFVRGDGRWLADAWDSAEERIARTIAGAVSDADAWENVACAADGGFIDEALVRGLGDRAIIAVNHNQLESADRALRVLTRIAETDGSPLLIARARTTESIVRRYGKTRDFERAVVAGTDAVRFAEQSGDADLIAFTLLNLSRAHQFRTGLPTSGEPFLRRVLDYTDVLEDKTVVARAAMQIAVARIDRGDYRGAFQYAQLAEAIPKLVEDYNREYAAEYTLGLIHYQQRDFELAVPRFRHAVQLAILAPFPSGVVSALSLLAICYRNLGDTVRFRETVAETLRRGEGTTYGNDAVGLALVDVAFDAIKRNDLAAAEKALADAAPHAKASINKSITASAAEATAVLRLKQHRYEEAIAGAAEVERLADAESEQQRFDTAVVSAEAHRHLGRVDLAEAVLRRSIATSETARGDLGDTNRLARLFFNSRVSAYVELIDLLIEKRDTADALQVAERAKSRALLDMLTLGSHRATELSDADRTREEQLVAAVTAANRAVEDARAKTAAADAMQTLDTALQERRLTLEQFRSELALRHPLLPLQRGDAAAPTAAELIAVVPEDTTAIEYVLTDTRLHIFTIVHERNREPRLRVHSVAIDDAAFEKQIHRFVGRIANRDLDYRRGARQLYDVIVAPIEQEIAATSSLRIVPAGPLWSLPFEALRDRNGKFLVERKTVSYIPSLTVWRELERHRAPRVAKTQSGFFGIGNPRVDATVRATVRGDLGPLPEAETEVRTISKMFEGRAEVLVGANAAEQRIKDESPSFRILHFATHARVDDHNPMYSHIVLARGRGQDEDGLLEAWEMMQLDLHADLAVLSACDTARGEADAGEGVVGMSWALLAAGCRSTVASEWKVPSAATADLMIGFYDRWLQHGTPRTTKARALRDARLAMLRDPRRAHPYYWASFVLIGAAD